MSLALDQFLGRPAGPDGFADPSESTSRRGVFGHELSPRGDDPSRVQPDFGHVRESDPVRVAIHPRPKHVDLGGAHDDQDRLVRADGVLDERPRPIDEVGLSGIKESLMAKVSPRGAGSGRRGRRQCVTPASRKPSTGPLAVDGQHQYVQWPHPPTQSAVRSSSARRRRTHSHDEVIERADTLEARQLAIFGAPVVSTMTASPSRQGPHLTSVAIWMYRDRRPGWAPARRLRPELATSSDVDESLLV